MNGAYILYILVVPQGGLLMPRAKITVSLPIGIIEWLDGKVKDGTFRNMSDGVECCIKEVKERNYCD